MYAYDGVVVVVVLHSLESLTLIRRNQSGFSRNNTIILFGKIWFWIKLPITPFYFTEWFIKQTLDSLTLYLTHTFHIIEGSSEFQILEFKF